jgi:hypothetical protein
MRLACVTRIATWHELRCSQHSLFLELFDSSLLSRCLSLRFASIISFTIDCSDFLSLTPCHGLDGGKRSIATLHACDEVINPTRHSAWVPMWKHILIMHNRGRRTPSSMRPSTGGLLLLSASRVTSHRRSSFSGASPCHGVPSVLFYQLRSKVF